MYHDQFLRVDLLLGIKVFIYAFKFRVLRIFVNITILYEKTYFPQDFSIPYFIVSQRRYEEVCEVI